jgi:hypothetical protein
MVRLFLLGSILLFCLAFNCSGQTSDSLATVTPKQYYLVLGKPNKPKRFWFYEGNIITLKLLGTKDYYTGEITAIHNNAIIFWQTEIKLHEIEKIRIGNKTHTQKFTRAVSAVFRKGGILFMIVGAGNFILVPAARSDGLKTMTGALALYGTGQALKVLQKRNYKTKGRWRLKTIETIY